MWVELVGVCVWLMSCVNVHCGLPPRVCPCIACGREGGDSWRHYGLCPEFGEVVEAPFKFDLPLAFVEQMGFDAQIPDQN